jgi:hypothetical protein
MDPLVYWLSDLLPLANSVGILKSKFLLRAGMPFLKLLPGVPASAVTVRPSSSLTDTTVSSEVVVEARARPEATDVADDYRREESKKMIHLSKSHIVEGIVFYVVNVDGRYAGEFRYSSLLKLHYIARKLTSKKLPPFPGKAVFGLSEVQLEERRSALENYLQFVLAEPEIVETDQFIQFVKQHRRWERDLPLLASPLM